MAIKNQKQKTVLWIDRLLLAFILGLTLWAALSDG